MTLGVNTWGNKGYSEMVSWSFIIVCEAHSPHAVSSVSRQSKQTAMFWATADKSEVDM